MTPSANIFTEASGGAPQQIYLREIHATLPRLLAGFDTNAAGLSRGFGDRYHWAWKLSDFPNATFQGAVNGLSKLVANGLLPAEMAAESIVARCHAMVEALPRLMRRDGSLEEAFPYEASFCVTSLVAHDVLAGLEALGERLNPRERDIWLGNVAPLIDFTLRHDETHGLISNHLATAANALFRWAALNGGHGEERGRQLLERIVRSQGAEGWFAEYGGADPGYQTLCMEYLTPLHKARPDLGLAEPLARSAAFLAHFAHPDGSFGGVYGQRNTRTYYPGGLAGLADECDAAAALAAFMGQSIASRACVTLAAIDPPNLVPMFNSYCSAACAPQPGAPGELPAVAASDFRREWPEAGLIVDKCKDAYTIINWRKGGVVYHFPRSGAPRIDMGVLARTAAGRLVSTQGTGGGAEVTVAGDEVRIRQHFTEITARLPGALDFVLLRLASLTVMRLSWARDLIKKALVRLLMTSDRRIDARNTRTITLGGELSIEDVREGGADLVPLPTPRGFVAIHGASQGYWQRGDDGTSGYG
ncbi:MAG: hypothetical protein Kow00114_30980 [Kiloniellaceae bacterium]